MDVRILETKFSTNPTMDILFTDGARKNLKHSGEIYESRFMTLIKLEDPDFEPANEDGDKLFLLQRVTKC